MIKKNKRCDWSQQLNTDRVVASPALKKQIGSSAKWKFKFNQLSCILKAFPPSQMMKIIFPKATEFHLEEKGFLNSAFQHSLYI